MLSVLLPRKGKIDLRGKHKGVGFRSYTGGTGRDFATTKQEGGFLT